MQEPINAGENHGITRRILWIKEEDRLLKEMRYPKYGR